MVKNFYLFLLQKPNSRSWREDKIEGFKNRIFWIKIVSLEAHIMERGCATMARGCAITTTTCNSVIERLKYRSDFGIEL